LHGSITSLFFGKKNLDRASAAQGTFEWLKRSFCRKNHKSFYGKKNLGRASAAQSTFE
jgi:hypothetical protein